MPHKKWRELTQDLQSCSPNKTEANESSPIYAHMATHLRETKRLAKTAEPTMMVSSNIYKAAKLAQVTVGWIRRIRRIRGWQSILTLSVKGNAGMAENQLEHSSLTRAETI